MIRRASRFILALLLLNLSLVGQELACAHEAQALEYPPATDHGSSPTHHAPVPPDPERTPCDESSSRCCAAVAPCAISGIPERGFQSRARLDIKRALIASTDPHLDSPPLEVATPPPRG